MNTIDRVKALIADHIGKPASEIGDDTPLGKRPDTHPSPLDLDSLDHVELVMAVEDHFGVEVPDDDAEKPEMDTPAGIAAYVDAVNARELALGAAAQDARTTGTGVILQGGGRVEHVPIEEFFVEPVPDYAAMSAGDMLAAVGMDAMKWADAFMQIACFDNPLGRELRAFPHGDRAPLHGTMLGWFANAIETARDVGRQPPEPSADYVRFRKKPVEIQAVKFAAIVDGVPRFHGDPNDLPDWLIEACAGPEGQPGSVWPQTFEGKTSLFIGTLEGDHRANDGDWIIRGVNGELYPCKPDIFAKTYDAVGDGDAQVGQPGDATAPR